MNHSNNAVSQCYFITLENNQPRDQDLKEAIFLTVINSLFSFTAFSFNAIVLGILWKSRLIRTPSYSVVACLALSDFFVGLFAQPLTLIVNAMSIMGYFSCTLWVVKEAVSWTLCTVSGLTMALTCVERFLALHLHMHYHTIITKQRLFVVYGSFYLFSLFLVLLWLAGANEKAMGVVVVVLSSSVLCIYLIMQYKILKLVRYHQTRIQQQINVVNMSSNMLNSIELQKYKRSTGTMMLIVFLCIVFYTPFLCTKTLSFIQGYTSRVACAYNITWGFVYINSTINPCIYCLRMKEIRHFVAQRMPGVLWPVKQSIVGPAPNDVKP